MWMLLFAAPAALLAVLQLGRLHPDEVYQSLEPAYFKVHGYGIMAWEWREGIRNWSVPLLFAGILKLCSALGIDDPRWYRAVLELPQYALHAWALTAVFRLSRRRLGADRPALAATALVAFYGLTVIFAGRTLSESFSASFLLLAFEALDRESEQPLKDGALGGLYLGLSVVMRYGSGVFVVAALGFLAAKRRWPMLKGVVASGAAVALGLLLLDWQTWGQPLHSLRAYIDFNVISGRAVQSFGASPAWFYAWPLFLTTPVWVWAGLIHNARFDGGARITFISCLAYVVVVAFTPHKESRFLYPAQALLTMVAAPGFVAQLLKLPVMTARALYAVAVALGLTLLTWLPDDLKDRRGDQFRAIVVAARDPNARGLLIVGDGIWGVGGYFYLGKNIPWGVADWPQDANFQAAIRSPVVNRAITRNDQGLTELEQAGFRVVEQIGSEKILARGE